MALHRERKNFSDLFKEATSFRQFEARVERLETTKDRGDAFEVFAEAYISLTPHMQSIQIWPFESIPEPVARKLKLDTPRDMGVDGLHGRIS